MNLLSTKSFTTAKVAYSTAKEHVMLTAQGAYLKLSGGNIEVHGPGAMTFKASHKELTGPASASATLPRLPSGELNLNQSVHHATPRNTRCCVARSASRSSHTC